MQIVNAYVCLHFAVAPVNMFLLSFSFTFRRQLNYIFAHCFSDSVHFKFVHDHLLFLVIKLAFVNTFRYRDDGGEI